MRETLQHLLAFMDYDRLVLSEVESQVFDSLKAATVCRGEQALA